MQTECPHCHTIFSVQSTDLESADGQVRCGHCLAIFAADDPQNIVNDDDQANIEAIEEAEETIEETVTTFPEEDIEHTIADVIPPELRAETRKAKPRFGFIGTTLLILAILASILAGAAQYAYYNRASLIKITELRPWLEKACVYANCTLPQAKDTKLFLLSSKNIFTHPNVKNALMVSATIVNQADFTQDFPIVELRFSNVRGETIAARRFSPEEYLHIPRNQISKMLPDTPVSFILEIKDPGNEMVSYEFDFL